MATTQRQKAVSNGLNIVIPSTQYSWLGEDETGQHHHYDKRTNTVYVTDDAADRVIPEGRATIHFRIDADDVDLEQDLEEHDAIDETTHWFDATEIWTDYVAGKRGWADQPIVIDASVMDGVTDALEGGEQ